jgi:hypothetical protein
MLYHGPVRVPKNAAKGKAIMRVEMPATSKYGSFATEIPVVIQ